MTNSSGQFEQSLIKVGTDAEEFKESCMMISVVLRNAAALALPCAWSGEAGNQLLEPESRDDCVKRPAGQEL